MRYNQESELLLKANKIFNYLQNFSLLEIHIIKVEKEGKILWFLNFIKILD